MTGSCSTAAYTQLSYNSGSKLSHILTAPSLLCARDKAIRAIKAARGDSCPVMSLAELMCTHVVFVAFVFKPYAALALCYAQYTPYGGASQYGQSVDLRIKHEGDFFGDCAMSATTPTATCNNAPVPVVASAADMANLTGLPASYFAVAGGIVGAPTYSYVDENGFVIAPGATGIANATGLALGYTNDATTGRMNVANWVRYVEYPGLQLIQSAQFKVQQSQIDIYRYFTALFFNKHAVPVDKRISFNRLVGQQNPTQGQTYQSLATAHSSGSVATTLAGAQVQPHQLYGEYVNGPQTPQPTAPQLNLLIPFIFDFCRRKDAAMPGMALPDGDREISVILAAANQIYTPAPSNVRIQETVLYTPTVGVTLLVSREFPILVPNSVVSTSTDVISNLYLFVLNIFVEEIVHDIFLYRIGFVMIRIFCEQLSSITANAGTIRLSNFKWAVEYFFFMGQPRTNNTVPSTSATTWSNRNYWKLWHRGANYNQLLSWQQDRTVSVTGGPPLTTATPVNSLHDALEVFDAQPVFETVELLTQSNPIWDNNPMLVYRDYVPYQFGGNRLFQSIDKDSGMVVFDLHPGLTQPSGMINLSRAREFDFVYTLTTAATALLTTVGQYNLIATALAINFLLIAECGVTIHYV